MGRSRQHWGYLPEGEEKRRKGGLNKDRLCQNRLEPNGLFTGKVEVALLPNEHGTANRVDDVVVAFGVDDLAVPQGLSLGGELVLDFQIV